MTYLDKIIDYKKNEIINQSKIIPLKRLKNSQRLFTIRNFKKALCTKKIEIIAEIKRKSPSEKNIYIDAKPEIIAKSYEENGAAAISVLTDSKFFGGKLDFLNQVKSVVQIPILRKDFIISEYQVWESFHAGADAILLIADAIDFALLSSLYLLAKDLGLHVLVETHNIDKLDDIKKLNPDIIGINCRDLKTMKTHLNWFHESIRELPKNVIKIAESGINLNSHLLDLHKIGYNAALVGTSLMKTKSPGKALSHLLDKKN